MSRPCAFPIARPPGLPEPISVVEIATPDDGDALVLFLTQIQDELSGGRGDIEIACAYARAFAMRTGGAALVVRGHDHDRHIEASIGLLFYREPLERRYHIRSIWNNVIPAARRSGHAKSLLIAAKQFADGLHLDIFVREDAPDLKAAKLIQPRKFLAPRAFVFGYSPTTGHATATAA